MRGLLLVGLCLLAALGLWLVLSRELCVGTPAARELEPRGTGDASGVPGPTLSTSRTRQADGIAELVRSPALTGREHIGEWKVHGRVIGGDGQPEPRALVRVRVPDSVPLLWERASEIGQIAVGPAGEFTATVPATANQVSLQAQHGKEFGLQVATSRDHASRDIVLALPSDFATLLVRVVESRDGSNTYAASNARVTFRLGGHLAIDEERQTDGRGEVSIRLPTGSVYVLVHTPTGGWRGRAVNLRADAVTEFIVPPGDCRLNLDVRTPGIGGVSGNRASLAGAFQSSSMSMTAFQPVSIPLGAASVAVTAVPAAHSSWLTLRDGSFSLHWTWPDLSPYLRSGSVRLDLSNAYVGPIRVVDGLGAGVLEPVQLVSPADSSAVDVEKLRLNLPASSDGRTEWGLVPFGVYKYLVDDVALGVTKISSQDVVDGVLVIRLPVNDALAGTVVSDSLVDLELEVVEGGCESPRAGVEPWRRPLRSSMWTLRLPLAPGASVGVRVRHTPSGVSGPCVAARQGQTGIVLQGPSSGVTVEIAAFKDGQRLSTGAVLLRHQDDFPERSSRRGETRLVLPYTYVHWLDTSAELIAFRHVRPGLYTVALLPDAEHLGVRSVRSTIEGELPPSALVARNSVDVAETPVRINVEFVRQPEK